MVLVSTAMTFDPSAPHPLVSSVSQRDEAIRSILGSGSRGEGMQGARFGSRIKEVVLTDVTAALQADTACGIFDASEWLPAIDVPTSIIITANDRVVPPSMQRAMGIAIGTRNPYIVRSRLGHLAVPLGAPDMLRNIEAACINVTQLNGRPLGAGRDLH